MLEDDIQTLFFNAHLLHKTLTIKVCYVGHSILNFKTKNHAIMILLDALLAS